jgi:hypothetical protein
MATTHEEIEALLQPLGIDSGDVERLKVALGATTEEETLSRLTALRIISLREMIEWLLSIRRFYTVSEIDSSRILSLFVEIRGEYPTVEQLVEQFDISSARAVSLLGRLKYGEGRALVRLARRASLAEITRKLGEQTADADSRKSLILMKASLDEVREVAFTIMSEPEHQKRGGQYEGAEFPAFSSSGRLGGKVTASEKMWGFITKLIEKRLA